jgi:uncharacterized glyoxalase superfamily protein PhnB
MANRPANTQAIIPYLSYQDAKAAIDFLAKAFGFEVRAVMAGEGQAVMHAELGLGDSVVYLGTPEGYDPKRALRDRNAAVLVYVDDVDAHYARAREAGAKIVQEPADMFYGDRVYNATDLEGQMWFFHTNVREVSPEEMQAALASMPAPAAPAARKRAAKRRAAKPRAVKARSARAKPKAKRAARKK